MQWRAAKDKPSSNHESGREVGEEGTWRSRGRAETYFTMCSLTLCTHHKISGYQINADEKIVVYVKYINVYPRSYTYILIRP
jgi:hypothetical protein